MKLRYLFKIHIKNSQNETVGFAGWDNEKIIRWIKMLIIGGFLVSSLAVECWYHVYLGHPWPAW